MNKLISRNLVLRFKLGKKLIKAQFGWQVRKDGVVVNRFGVPVRANDAGYRPYSMTQDISYLKEWPNDKQIAPGLYIEPETNDAYASRKDGNNGEASARLISEGFGVPANGTYYESTDATGKVVDRGRYFGGKKHSLPIGGTQQKRAYYLKGADGSLYLIGTDGSKTLISKGNKSANSSRTKVTNVSNSARLRNPGAYHNITTWQNKLKDFYEPGTFAVDGMWGKNTEAAYLKYLQLANIPELSLEEAREAKAQKMPIIPSIYGLMNPVEKDLKIPLSVPQTYNRTQIREFLRNKGVNPYSFSGDQRRALRMILNGQGTDADKALVQSMGIFKKGGQLPSKNPITRFRNRKFN